MTLFTALWKVVRACVATFLRAHSRKLHSSPQPTVKNRMAPHPIGFTRFSALPPSPGSSASNAGSSGSNGAPILLVTLNLRKQRLSLPRQRYTLITISTAPSLSCCFFDYSGNFGSCQSVSRSYISARFTCFWSICATSLSRACWLRSSRFSCATFSM